MIRKDFNHRLLRENQFALIVPHAVADIPAGIESRPIVPAGLSASAHLMPRLVNLHLNKDVENDALLDSIYESHAAGTPPVIAVLVQTSLGSEEFMHHWNRMQVVSPTKGTRSWLRLHDPRVLHLLLQILTTKQQRTLFGRSTALTYWLGGEWVTAMPDVDDTPSPVSGADSTWDWHRIERIGIVNRAYQGAGVHSASAYTASYPVAERLIERAGARYGLQADHDLVEFVTRGVLFGSNFDDHPELTRIIAPRSEADDDATLSDRLALVSDTVWDELRKSYATR